MQSDLEELYKWSRTNNMAFNGEKFQHLHYGPQLDDYRYLAPDGSDIQVSENIRDLGVTMSCNGNFEVQINNCVIKGRQLAGWIFRTFETRHSYPMMVVYKAIVLPALEYCCQIWSPKKLYLIKRVESVQRNFTAKVDGTAGMTYKERLDFLRIYSLERRRDRYTIIYVWKIIQRLVPNLMGKDKIKHTTANARLGRCCLLPTLNHAAPTYVQTLRENSFAIHGPRLFNILDKELRNFDGTLEVFKQKLDKFLATVNDAPMDVNDPQVVTSNSLLVQVAQGRLELRSLPQR